MSISACIRWVSIELWPSLQPEEARKPICIVRIWDSRLVSVETGIYQPTFKISTSAKNSIYLQTNRRKISGKTFSFMRLHANACRATKQQQFRIPSAFNRSGKGFDVCSSRLNEPNPCLISFAFLLAPKTVTTICFLGFRMSRHNCVSCKGIDFFVNGEWVLPGY